MGAAGEPEIGGGTRTEELTLPGSLHEDLREAAEA
jgi:hypothetical protein